MFLGRLRGKGEVQLTQTTLAAAGHWTYCLSFGMSDQITLTAEELGVSNSSEPFGVAWARTNLQAFEISVDGAELRHFSPSEPLSLSMQPPASRHAGDWGLYTYWRTAPTSCAGLGWTLLGEMEKLISVSAQRITNVTATCGTAEDDSEPSLSVDVVGAESELVALSFVRPLPFKSVVTIRVNLGSARAARVVCTGQNCAQVR